MFSKIETPETFNTDTLPATLEGGWVLDYASKNWGGKVSSVYYTRGAYGSGEVLRISDHWAGDEGIDSIDGHDWRVGGESGTWRAGLATMADLEDAGCYHWIPEAAQLTGDETFADYRARFANLETLRATTPGIGRLFDMICRMQNRIIAAALVAGHSWEELTDGIV